MIMIVEYFEYLGRLIPNDATYEMKSRIVMAKAALNKKKHLFTSKLDLNLKKKLMKCCIGGIAFLGLKIGHFGL
jgi:hypothetical protein